MATATQSAKYTSMRMIGLGILAAAAVTLGVSFIIQADAATPIVLVRGIVKGSDDANTMNLYVTHVSTAPDASAIRGRVLAVNTSNTTKYKWTVVNGVLTKSRIKTNPPAEQEVVVRGTLSGDDRIIGSWLTQNYRRFQIEGTVEGRTLDTGKTDEGTLTVNITSSKLLGVKPATSFKESVIKGTEIKFRVDGLTAVSALGKTKHLDEVTANQQKVRLEGQLLDESNWSTTKVNEL